MADFENVKPVETPEVSELVDQSGELPKPEETRETPDTSEERIMLIAPLGSVLPNGFRLPVVDLSDEQAQKDLMKAIVCTDEDWVISLYVMPITKIFEFIKEWGDIYNLEMMKVVGVPGGEYNSLFNTRTSGIPVKSFSTLEESIKEWMDGPEAEKSFDAVDYALEDVVESDENMEASDGD